MTGELEITALAVPAMQGAGSAVQAPRGDPGCQASGRMSVASSVPGDEWALRGRGVLDLKHLRAHCPRAGQTVQLGPQSVTLASKGQLPPVPTPCHARTVIALS